MNHVLLCKKTFIWHYVILGLLILVGVIDIIHSSYQWLAPTPGDIPMGDIFLAVFLLFIQIIIALIGFILSLTGLIKSNKIGDKIALKYNIIFLIVFIILPFIFWYINALILAKTLII